MVCRSGIVKASIVAPGAERGKKISPLPAAQLLATAQAIEVALNCQ